VDDNFTLDPDRAVELSERFIAKGWDLIWAAMTRVDTVVRNPCMVRTMAKAGLKWTFIGFECGSQESLDRYGKRARVADALKAMEILRANGVNVTGAFILGAQHETKQMMMDTIRFSKQVNPRRAQYSLLTPYPGSKIYASLKDRLMTRDWTKYSGLWPVIKMEHVTPDELRRIQIAAYASFYTRPRKAIENLSYVRRALPSATVFLARRALSSTARLGCRLIGGTRKYLNGVRTLLG
jgi:anaerobic magnesium-protoporphyrin IX monomethyl ester cyclase